MEIFQYVLQIRLLSTSNPVKFFLSILVYFQCTDHSSSFNDPSYRAGNQFISILVEMLNLKLLLLLMIRGQAKVHPRTSHEGPEGEQRYRSTLSLTSGPNWGEWSKSRPDRFTPGNDPVPTVQKAGRALGPVWTGTEHLVPTGLRFLDGPARSVSLNRLSYPSPR